MEKFDSLKRGDKMKKYIKPSVININNKYNIAPLAFVTGLSAASAFAIGVASGLFKGDDKNGSSIALRALPKCDY